MNVLAYYLEDRPPLLITPNYCAYCGRCMEDGNGGRVRFCAPCRAAWVYADVWADGRLIWGWRPSYLARKYSRQWP